MGISVSGEPCSGRLPFQFVNSLFHFLAGLESDHEFLGDGYFGASARVTGPARSAACYFKNSKIS